MFERKSKETIGSICVEISIKVKLSLWDAIRLRIAGKNAAPIAEEIVRQMSEATRSGVKSTTEVAGLPL